MQEIAGFVLSLLFVSVPLRAETDVFVCGPTPTKFEPLWASEGEETTMTCAPKEPVCIGTSGGACLWIGPAEAIQEIGVGYTVGEGFCMAGSDADQMVTVIECERVK